MSEIFIPDKLNFLKELITMNAGERWAVISMLEGNKFIKLSRTEPPKEETEERLRLWLNERKSYRDNHSRS